MNSCNRIPQIKPVRRLAIRSAGVRLRRRGLLMLRSRPEGLHSALYRVAVMSNHRLDSPTAWHGSGSWLHSVPAQLRLLQPTQ